MLNIAFLDLKSDGHTNQAIVDEKPTKRNIKSFEQSGHLIEYLY